MVPIERIDHVGIVVDDLKSARRLLEETFGLSVWREISNPGVEAAFLDFGNASVELIEFSAPERRKERLGESSAARIDHLALQVHDLGEAIGTLEAFGFRFTGPPETNGRFTSVWTVPDSSDGVRYQIMEVAPETSA